MICCVVPPDSWDGWRRCQHHRIICNPLCCHKIIRTSYALLLQLRFGHLHRSDLDLLHFVFCPWSSVIMLQSRFSWIFRLFRLTVYLDFCPSLSFYTIGRARLVHSRCLWWPACEWILPGLHISRCTDLQNSQSTGFFLPLVHSSHLVRRLRYISGPLLCISRLAPHIDSPGQTLVCLLCEFPGWLAQQAGVFFQLVDNIWSRFQRWNRCPIDLISGQSYVTWCDSISEIW